MKNSYRYFRNHECKYFPCHSEPGEDEFNCLFCFCPLYALGDKCGGIFDYTDKGTKICTDCPYPHTAGYYDVIIEKLKDAKDDR